MVRNSRVRVAVIVLAVLLVGYLAGFRFAHPVKEGVVVLSKNHPQYGNTVVVRHSNGIESLYAHMSQLLVKVGDKVTHDSVLGYIGNTGVSTGKH